MKARSFAAAITAGRRLMHLHIGAAERVKTGILAAGVAALALALPIPAQAQAEDGWWFCVAVPQGSSSTDDKSYVSGIFHATRVQTDVIADFTNFLNGAYGARGHNVTCGASRREQYAREGLESLIEHDLSDRFPHVVRTLWTD